MCRTNHYIEHVDTDEVAQSTDALRPIRRKEKEESFAGEKGKVTKTI